MNKKHLLVLGLSVASVTIFSIAIAAQPRSHAARKNDAGTQIIFDETNVSDADQIKILVALINSKPNLYKIALYAGGETPYAEIGKLPIPPQATQKSEVKSRNADPQPSASGSPPMTSSGVTSWTTRIGDASSNVERTADNKALVDIVTRILGLR